jgi:hypothetical protein
MSDYEPGDTLVEALRRSNPIPAGSLDRRSLPSADALFGEIVTHRTRRVRRRVLLVALALVLVALMLMAFVQVRRVGTSLSVAPVCYGADSLGARRVVVGAGDPEHACAQVWAGGEFGARAVPDFDVCVLSSGVPAVFPGEAGSVCSRLDLPQSSGDNRVERFVDAVNREVSATCIGRYRALQVVDEEIAKRDVPGWKAEIGAGWDDPSRMCASIAADPATNTISIVAIKDPRA